MKPMASITKSRMLTGVMAALVFALAGCERGKHSEAQVIARVNADEISVHQLNLAISQVPGDARSAIGRDKLLEKLVDRQLAVQQALAQNLERRPDVMLRLEEARRDILATAYAEEIARKHQAPDENAAARYYAAHPGLFAERRVYRLREISIPGDAPALAGAEARLARRERLGAVVEWLQQQGGRYGDQLALRPAEQLPIEVVDKLSRSKPGDTVAVRLPRALVAYEVLSAEAAALSWNAAAPIIKAHLAKQQGSSALAADLQQLRASASISRTRLAD